ncbi:PQQ-binding-like beta-propeller repeat protein [Marivirga salinae]|uniref:PQQ-binding-like beta-propeller repeat protein n=1 Tax=Marivirga salinarum TaxID=3059078 RepID=A0AA51NBZ1_9BACT|nr:PQQ-binding-like beta-propeller repeat protein [Marivirga sp. BDSF4-3]WMN10781.1 PQQ-binding-like beta-propeller repeat protein [Marivirga sp. BDSF4-3]
MSLISSCSLFKDEDPSKDFYQPLWGYNFNIGYYSSIDPILYSDKVIFSALDEKKNDFSANSTLEAFDKEEGNLIWRWDNNIPVQYDKFLNIHEYYINNQVLYISSGWEYGINLGTGETLFDNNHTKSNGVSFYGKDNWIFTNFTTSDNSYESIEFTERNNFEWKVLLESRNRDTSIYYYRHTLFDDFFPNRIYFPYTKWNGEESRPNLLIYDFENKKVILDEPISIMEGNHFIDNKPVLNGNKIYLPIHGLVACINKNTSELIWQKKVNGNTSASGLLYAGNNLLYVKAEFGLYCIDPENGNTLWSNEGSGEGNASRLQYHNDVIYYIGGAKFNAVDASTGEKLLSFEAPSRADDDGAFFQGVMTIDHENDKIYTASYTHAYCYPTLR